MKKIILLFAITAFAITTQAQLGGVAMGVGSQLIGMRPKAKLQKHWMFNLQTVYSIGISNAIGGSKNILPPTFVSAEYGINTNYTVGIMLGLNKTQSKNVYNQFIDLFGNVVDDTSSGARYYNIKYTLLGVTGKYNFIGGPNSNLFIATRAGLKMGNKQRVNIGNSPLGTIIGDPVSNAFDAATNYFFSTTFGMNAFLNKEHIFAITPEVGYGYGFGDGISFGTNSLLLSIGITYHIKPRSKY